MLKVLGRVSSINVRKVLWTCAELGLDFEREDWGHGFRPTDAAAFRALNPNALVPVISDDGFVLWESNTIIRYLAASRGAEPLYPAEPQRRARVDQWIDWQATDLNGSWSYAFMALVRRSSAHRDAAAITASGITWAGKMAILERQLETTGGFVYGVAFKLADVPIGLSVHRWFGTPVPHPDHPAVAVYYERLSQRPGFLRYGRNGPP